jgi:heptosyltransferase-2
LKRSAAKFTLAPGSGSSPSGMREFSLYVLYRSVVALVTAFPIGALFRLGQAFGFCAWLVLPHYRRLALRNVTIAFAQEKSPRELRRLVRQHFQRLGANLLCGVKVGVMPLEQVQQRTVVENVEGLARHLRAGRGVVVVLSHLGNWELNSQVMPKFISPARNSTIYQKLGNRRVDEHVRKLRARAGVEMFDRKDGFHKPIELLRSGGVIGILSDQHAGDQGLWVPFFGKLASTSPLPALLAKRTGAALVGLGLYTEGVARWRIVVESPLDTASDSVESLTAKSNEMLAAQIRRAPEDWFWVHNRWKTPRPNFLLNRYKRGIFLPDGSEKLKPFRILVRSSNWLGDAVMSVPAVRAIKKGRPDAHVTIAAAASLAPMWKLVPEVDEIIALPGKSLLGNARLISGSRFDVGILFPNSLRSALEMWVARIPRRVGYRGHSRSWLVNQIVRERGKHGPPEHHALRFLHLAHELGAAVDESILADVSRNGHVDLASTRIALSPGAEYGPAKRWLPDRFAEVATAVGAQRHLKWVLFGTITDAELGEHIAAKLGDSCENRIGQTTVEQLIDELRACRLLLSNDTGTMHLAALLGLPVVAVFGSTEPALTSPLGQGHVVVRHHVECSPCFLRECPIDFRCMHAVTVDEVREAVMSILRAQENGTATITSTAPK